MNFAMLFFAESFCTYEGPYIGPFYGPYFPFVGFVGIDRFDAEGPAGTIGLMAHFALWGICARIQISQTRVALACGAKYRPRCGQARVTVQTIYT